jgi:hypothetical protein
MQAHREKGGLSESEVLSLKRALEDLRGIPPRQAALLNDMFPIKHVALRLTLRSVDAGRGSGRG